MKKNIILIIAVLISIFGFYIVKNKSSNIKNPYYKEMVDSKNKVLIAFKLIKEEKIKKGILIDSSIDINETGIIGEDFNSITTTIGDLVSKRTSANADFAPIIIKMIKELNIKEGEFVGINASSSFPALNIATIVALEKLNINPVLISSLGSSTYGANNFKMTYLEMESLLYKNKIINTESILYSIGGQDDIGKNMDNEELRKILSRLNPDKLYYEGNYEKNIKHRINIYEGKNIKAFINIGGNEFSFGKDENNDLIYYSGIIKNNKSKENSLNKGLVQYFLNKNIPVINLLNIKQLALKYDLEIDPKKDTETSNLYYIKNYNKLAIFFLCFSLFFICFIYRKVQKNEF